MKKKKKKKKRNNMATTGVDVSTKIPSWNGSPETAGIYCEKLIATVEVKGYGDALDESKMQGLPTKTEYDTLDATNDATEIAKFEMNKKVMAMIVLGQESAQGMAAINKTKTVGTGGHIYGVAHKVVSSIKSKYVPSDSSAEIDLENELEKIKFRSSANTYYIEAINVSSRYSVMKSDKEMIKIMSKKVRNSTYSKMILDELKKTNPNFETLCEEITTVQRLQKSTPSGSEAKEEKEVHLTSNENKEKSFPGKCGKCDQYGHKRADCPKKNGSKKKCNHCGKTGHLEASCWQKDPSKAPEHIRKKIQKEAGGASVEKEIQLCSLGLQDFA